MTKFNQHPLEQILQNRVAIIDGAMGTTIRTYGMTEADIRGDRFKDSTKSLLNNGDLFTLTKPEIIGDIHRRFLEAGAEPRHREGEDVPLGFPAHSALLFDKASGRRLDARLAV